MLDLRSWLLLLSFSSPSFATVLFERDQHSLRLKWDSDRTDSWSLFTEDGAPCARGATKNGYNEVSISKIAHERSLVFQAGESKREIPPSILLSPLAKPKRPVTIYQIPVRTYFAAGSGESLTGKLNNLTTQVLNRLKELNIDYIWLTGILEHANRYQSGPQLVKGDAGSFYAIRDSWDISSLVGDLDAFERLIERAHAVGLRLMMDLVPNHSARIHQTTVACKQSLNFGSNDDASVFFAPANNYFYLPGERLIAPVSIGDAHYDEFPAKVTGNDVISARPNVSDWYDTAKLNYGFDIQSRSIRFTPVPRTWQQMTDIAQYWVTKGVDGFRADFVHSVPLEFWHYFAQQLRRTQPNVFLLGEAYESDTRMRVPGVNYESLLGAGFDSIYHSDLYHALRHQAQHPGGFIAGIQPSQMAFMRPALLAKGAVFTNYLENHDELRVASREFAPAVTSKEMRVALGFSMTAYSALMPGHFLLHGGQELGEDAKVHGPFAGNNGRTSIFDFVFQPETLAWLKNTKRFRIRELYRDVLKLRTQPPFSLPHNLAQPSFIDLGSANGYGEQAKYVGAYLRFGQGKAYLVVTNSNPFNATETTIHFTSADEHDSLGALAAMGVANGEQRYVFTEALSRPQWVPQDPAIIGDGVPGAVLYKSGNIPSGLYLGLIPPATTYVFVTSKL